MINSINSPLICFKADQKLPFDPKTSPNVSFKVHYDLYLEPFARQTEFWDSDLLLLTLSLFTDSARSRMHCKVHVRFWRRPFFRKLYPPKPGHFSRTLAKGPNTTTWIWNLHADAHDFDSHTSDLEEISRKVFSAHFGQLGVIFIWLSGCDTVWMLTALN